MTRRDDLDQQLSAFLREGPADLPDPSFDAVRDRIEQTRQRAVIGSLGVPDMNKFLAIGLGTAAVVVAVLIGSNLLGGGSPPPGGAPSESAAPSEAEPSVAPSEVASSAGADRNLPEGPFVWFDPASPVDPDVDDGPPITVTIPASGWVYTDSSILWKGDEVDNLPESAFLWTSTTRGILVYGDPCRSADSLPDTPAATADEVIAALAAQPGRDASDPVGVTIGGYAASRLTLHVPDDAVFTDCDGGEYASYTLEGYEGAPWRWQQGPGQIDTYWVVDVDGAIVIMNGMYRPDTSAERIEEMRSIAESATFELP